MKIDFCPECGARKISPISISPGVYNFKCEAAHLRLESNGTFGRVYILGSLRWNCVYYSKILKEVMYKTPYPQIEVDFGKEPRKEDSRVL